MRLANLIESKINKHKKGIKVYWWRPSHRDKRNFGDEITPVLIEKLWGTRCLWTRLADCDMVGAGSILDIVAEHNPKGHKVKVWGSGFIEEGPSLENDDATICLVRGPLTASRITGGEKTPVGDPGLLVSRIFQKSGEVKHKVGVVLHMKDIDDTDTLEGISKDVLVISPYQAPEKVAADITSCEIVFSSSLHGLIFSDSFGVPNFRIKANELEGGDYKFQDYYDSTDRSPRLYSLAEVKDITSSSDELQKLKAAYKPIMNLERMQDIIIAAFPFGEAGHKK